MIIEHVCFYPGDFAPPTRFHMDTLFWLMTRNEVGHVNIVIGKDPSNNITQDQKAKLWELLLKSSMAPKASIIKSKDTGPMGEIYNIFSKKPDMAGYIALDESTARNKELQKKLHKFSNYGFQLVPSQFKKSSAAMVKAIQENNKEVIKQLLPEDFHDNLVDAYIDILKVPANDPEAPEEKSSLLNYKQQYNEMFSDGFWNSVFQPIAEDIDVINEAISDSAKKKAIEKFKKERPEATEDNIKYYVDKFSNKQGASVIKQKDIFQYTFDDLEKLIDANFPSTTDPVDDGEEVDFSGSEDVVYNENGLLILLGDLKEKCIRYGRGESWCISQPGTRNMFFSYRMRLNEPVFYFVFDEDKPKEDKYSKIVIYIDANGEYHVADKDNKGDKKMTWSEIEQIQPKLKGLQKLFKHIPLTAQEKKDYERFSKNISDEEYYKLTFDEKEKYIKINQKLSGKQIKETPKELIALYAVTTIGENLPKDIEKQLSPSDQKKLRDNRLISGDLVALGMIKNLDHLSENEKLEAIKKNGFAIALMTDPSEELQLAAVEKDYETLRLIENPTEKVKLTAVKKDGFAIQFIKTGKSEEVKLAAVTRSPRLIANFKNPSEEMQLAVIKRDINVIRNIENPTEKVQLFVIEEDPRYIEDIKNPTEKVKKLAKELLNKQ